MHAATLSRTAEVLRGRQAAAALASRAQRAHIYMLFPRARLLHTRRNLRLHHLVTIALRWSCLLAALSPSRAHAAPGAQSPDESPHRTSEGVPSPIEKHRCIHDQLEKPQPLVSRQSRGRSLLGDGKEGALSRTLSRTLSRPLSQGRSTDRLSRQLRSRQLRSSSHRSQLPGMRIVFNTETVSSDTRTCSRVGELVKMGGAIPGKSPECSERTPSVSCMYRCLARDVLSARHHTFMRTKLLPAISHWFGAALRMREPVADRLRFKRGPCGFGGLISIPEHIYEEGAADADLLIFVTARPITPGSTAVAFAGHCQVDGSKRE